MKFLKLPFFVLLGVSPVFMLGDDSVAMQTFMDISTLNLLLPFVFVVFALALHDYMLRRYNKKLSHEVEQKVAELEVKDKLLRKNLRMAAMGEMLSIIAHQWRQPLSAINSTIIGIWVKLASGKLDLNNPEDQKAFLAYLEEKHHAINEYVQYLSETTDDFRNFFNPDKSKEHIDLTTPVKKALELVQIPMENKEINIITDFACDDALDLYRNEIMQVILNLLRNAEDNFRQYPVKNAEIKISTFKEEEMLCIRIADNGGGIPKKILSSIFEPYFTTKDETVGSGLGLYMAKIMVEDHNGGVLEVENISTSTTTGVCFTLRFKENNV